MTENELLHYWDYFCSLCSQFARTQQYVDHRMIEREGEIVFENGETFSNEYLQTLFSACGEFETVAKLLCKRNVPDFNDKSNITDITSCILAHYPKIGQTRIRANRYEFTPLSEWGVVASEGNAGKVEGIKWWSNYNEIKHRRFDNYSKADLKNCFYSLSSLYVLELYLARSVVDSIPVFLASHPCEYFGCPYVGEVYLGPSKYDLPDFEKNADK